MSNKRYVPTKVTRHRSEADYPAWAKTMVDSVHQSVELESPMPSFSPAPVPSHHAGAEQRVEPISSPTSLARNDVRVRGRVVWSGDISPNGVYKLGVEFDGSSPALWGKDYDLTKVEISELDEP
jgi:hypothetical protein